MRSALHEFLNIISRNRAGDGVGIYSICSAHPGVLRASIGQSALQDSLVIIESTSNQVNQNGGYTGLRPGDFASLVHDLARESGFPSTQILLGGDHLGPYPWRDKPAETAMILAEKMVSDYVTAGYRKIHLDASMRCADDRGDDHSPLSDGVVAERTARLCHAAEGAWRELGEPNLRPVYVIGTEVPTPGGATKDGEELTPTDAKSARRSVDVTHEAFDRAGLGDAWARVIAVVVQPGVEFGDDQVVHYNSDNARHLKMMIESQPEMVFEAHSTDYQTESNLRDLVQDHFCILKVGPWLTFAYREALLSLEAIEREMLSDSAAQLSYLGRVLDTVMQKYPEHWQNYYNGSDAQKAHKRRFSFSDRSRYYWTYPDVTAAVNRLVENLGAISIPLSVVSQYLPDQFDGVQTGLIRASVSDLVRDRIQRVLRKYARACALLRSPGAEKCAVATPHQLQVK